MDLKEHKKAFEKIIKKYGLADEQKADEISKFLTKGEKISYKEFATLFNISEEDSKIFLSFIYKGIEFKESHIDPNKKN